MLSHLNIPTRWIGPIQIQSSVFTGDAEVPVSTFETPLWPSLNRGARLSRLCQAGIAATLLRDTMTRSILVQCESALDVQTVLQDLAKQDHEIAQCVTATSRHLTFDKIHAHQVGNLLYIRLSIHSHNASGHNMATKAADALMQWLLQRYPSLDYVSISGNMCTDKKNSAINSILGRGKHVVTELMVPQALCESVLRATPQQIHDLNTKKNLIGSIASGGVCSANAHAANTLLATYLATGQDAANIVEGSQCIVHTETREEGLYFSVTLPNIIVGTVGNGKHLSTPKAHLMRMGCSPEDPQSSQKLAIIIAAAVLCGEISLLAAQCNPGELMRAHTQLERRYQEG